MESPSLDPSSARGSRFGLIFIVTLCVGLLLWALAWRGNTGHSSN